MEAEILIKTENILEAREAITSLKQQNDELKARVAKLKSSLDWQVGAKEGINDNLAAIEGYLEKQSSFLENASNLCNSVVSSTEETSNALIAAISALMLSIIGISSVAANAINRWRDGFITSPDGNVTTTITNTNTDSTTTYVLPNVQDGSTVKNYTNSSVNYKEKDYSNYNVVGAYDESQVLNQKDPRWQEALYWKNSDGTNKLNSKGQPINAGCVCTAEAMTYNMKHPESSVSPLDCKKEGNTAACSNQHSIAVPDSKGASVETQRDMIYTNISNGEATMVRLTKGHTVTAVGVRDGASQGSLSNDDILVVDPADGKVKTLSEACGGNKYDIDPSWSLRTAK